MATIGIGKMEVHAPTLSASVLTAIQRQYGYRVAHQRPMRVVTGLVCEGGSRVVWKPLGARSNPANLPVVSLMTTRLNIMGIPAAGPLPTTNGTFVCSVSEETFSDESDAHEADTASIQGTLQPWLSGSHVKLARRQERLGAVASVAAVHRVTAWQQVAKRLAGSAQLMSVPALHWMSGRRTPLLRKMQLKARLLASMWDPLTHDFPELKQLRYHFSGGMAIAGTAWEADPQAGGEAVHICFCHRDLAPHNLLWQGRRIGLIDFDQSAFDDRLGDPLQLLNHALRTPELTATGWYEMAHLYTVLAGCSAWEAERLRRLLHFPDVLARAGMEWMRTRAEPGTTRRADVHESVLRAIETEKRRLDWL